MEPQGFAGSARRRQGIAALAAILISLLTIAASPLLFPVGAAGAGETPGQPDAEGTVILPVWAYADGDTPLAGARVRVLSSDRELPQVDAGAREFTSSRGTSLLEFTELPSDFTVVVSGGEARGEQLESSFRAAVRGYVPSDVVHVSPVTTLVDADWRARQRDYGGATLADATRGVERLLRIPRHQDSTDLRRSDELFDGDAFLRLAGKRGGVGALINRLVRLERRPGDAVRRFRDHSEDVPRLGGRLPRALISGDLVKKGLEALLSTAVGKLSDYLGLPDNAKETLIGWVMAGWAKASGEDPEELTNPDMVQIREYFRAIGQQLTEVEADVAKTKLDVLVALTNDTMGKIDHAEEQLSLLANLPQNDRTKEKFAGTINTYIEGNLLDAPAILQRHLGGNVPLADNVIKAASQAVLKQGRFFDAHDSAKVKSVYDYYALYQTELAILLTNYWHTKPDTYSDSVIQAGIAGIERNIDEQKSLLKPTVPHGAVVDTKTNKMWTQNYHGNPVDASHFFRREQTGGQFSPLKTVWPQEWHGPTKIAGLPFGDWTLPKKADVATLVDGRDGAEPAHWLDRVAGMSQRQTAAGRVYLARPDGWQARLPTRSLTHYLHITRYDMLEGKFFQSSINWCSGANQRCRDALRNKLQDIKGAAMYVRSVGTNESYWW